MFWPQRVYDQYVEDHSTIAETADLTGPPDRPVDPGFPNVAISFFPMADWMAWYDLTPDPAAFRRHVHRYKTEIADYRRRLREQFAPLPKTAAGRALLADIGRRRHVARFVPNWNWSDLFNADARPRSNVNAADDWLGATERGVRLRVRGRLRRATGRGSDSLIRYTPQMWGPGGASKMAADADAPDAILFHELVHASRQMRGAQRYRDVNRDYGFVEEYLATVLTNIYMSERGMKGLLGSYGGTLLKDPDGFIYNSQRIDMSPRELIRLFKEAQPEFCAALAAIDERTAPFNPARQYEIHLRAGRALGQTLFGG